MRIGKVSTAETAAAPTITVVKHNGVAEQFAPDNVYELMLPIRVDERVRVNPNSGTGRKADQKIGLFPLGIRYCPALLVGRGEASKVMTAEGAKRHFTMPLQLVQDLSRLMSTECQIYQRNC